MSKPVAVTVAAALARPHPPQGSGWEVTTFRGHTSSLPGSRCDVSHSQIEAPLIIFCIFLTICPNGGIWKHFGGSLVTRTCLRLSADRGPWLRYHLTKICISLAFRIWRQSGRCGPNERTTVMLYCSSTDLSLKPVSLDGTKSCDQNVILTYYILAYLPLCFAS